MNRVIKFRAWDKEEKFMISADDYCLLDAYEPLSDLIEQAQENFILMQYVGFNDKYGQSIYEGDLLIYDDDKDVMFEVFYHDEYAQFLCTRNYYRNNRCGGHIPRLEYGTKLNVIGNIYENPELMEIKNV